MVWYEQNQMKVRHFLLLSFKMFCNVMLLYPLTFTSAFCTWLTIGSFVDDGSSGNSPYADELDLAFTKISVPFLKCFNTFKCLVWKSCTDLIGWQYHLDYDYSHFIYFTAAHLIEILLTRNSLHWQTSAKRPDSVDGSVNRSCDLKDKVAGESRQTDRQTYTVQQFLQAPLKFLNIFVLRFSAAQKDSTRHLQATKTSRAARNRFAHGQGDKRW